MDALRIVRTIEGKFMCMFCLEFQHAFELWPTVFCFYNCVIFHMKGFNIKHMNAEMRCITLGFKYKTHEYRDEMHHFVQVSFRIYQAIISFNSCVFFSFRVYQAIINFNSCVFVV